jgi:hypothetical protein
MRTLVLLAAVVSFLAAPLTAQAGRLDIFILQFVDERDQASIEEALGKVDMLKVTNSDRTETSVKGLRGGNVIFVQSLPISTGQNFASSTRLDNRRADVSGTLSGSSVSVRVTLMEGVKVGLRKYKEFVYEGAGAIGGGVPHLISINRSTNKTMEMVKDRQRTITYDSTTIIIAQYTP